MADSFRLLLLLMVLGLATSEITKLKSNPDGNFAIGFRRGYINSGKYGVIVPKGDVGEKRQIQIRGAAWDSVTMEFNTQTIVFSDWDGMFMLGETVYTDTLGTLYFVRSDKKCVRKKYKRQMGEMQVIEKENLDRIVCEAVRTKVEKAVSHFLTSPFKYLLPSATDKLKRTPGFPGGDFLLGLKHGEITCGQHTIDVPTGDEHKPKVIKITAPGVSDEIKMVFDSDTKVFGSWDGTFYLGDKVFSVQPRTLIIKKDDGSCIKKYYEAKGAVIVIDQSVLLKQEDCFLIKSKAFGAMQKLRKPSMSSDEKSSKKKKQKRNSSSSSSTSTSSSNEASSKKKGYSSKRKSSGKFKKGKPATSPPPPIHVTSTVIIPKGNQQNQQTVQKPQSPNAIVLPAQNNPTQPQIIALQGTQPQSYYVQNDDGQQPAMILQPLNTQSTPANDILLAGPDKIVNFQNNDIDLNTLGEPITIQNIDPNQQVMIPQGYVRVGRSIAGGTRPDNVLNTQVLDVDATAIVAARKGQSDTKIVGVQKSNLITPNTASDMKTTQITTVTLPSNEKSSMNSHSSSGKKTSQDIFVDTNVIVDQGSLPEQNKDSITVLPAKTIPIAVSSPSKLVNVQKNDVTLGKAGSVINIQKNVVKLHAPSLPTTYIPVLDETNTTPVLVRIGREIRPSDLNKVVNAQVNEVKSFGSGDVKNIQSNKVNIDSPNLNYVLPVKGQVLTYGTRKPGNVLNFQKNQVDVDGFADVNNIQRNDVGLRSLDMPIVLKTQTPQVLMRVARELRGNAYVQQLVPTTYNNVLKIQSATGSPLLVSKPNKEVVNFQKNDVDLDGLGDVKNIQKNSVDVDSNTNVIMDPSRGPVLLSMPNQKVLNLQNNNVNMNGGGDLKNFQINNVKSNVVNPQIMVPAISPSFVRVSRSIANVQKNDVNLNGFGDVNNIQKNILKVDSADQFIINPAGRSTLVVSPPKNTLNYQNNEVDMNGGNVKNVQINDVVENEKPTLILGSRKKRSVPQDVYYNQILNVDGSAVTSSASQGSKIISLQGNDILVPAAPDGSVVMPNMKSSQVTKLTLPPQPGTSASQPPQKMYIKTNVLYKQNPQQTQPGPMYVQSPSVSSNRPTFVQLVPASQPQVVVTPQVQTPPQTFYVSSSQPPIIVRAASLQSQSNQKQPQPSLILANGATTVNTQVHPGGVLHTIRQETGGATAYTVVHTPTPPSSGQGRIPVSLMKDLTMLKKMYNPSSMIVNIAQNTNFHKK